jgi:hypothetical protein
MKRNKKFGGVQNISKPNYEPQIYFVKKSKKNMGNT